MAKCIGVVMARDNSVRYPDKNIADIGGKPLLGYAIDSIKTSGIADTVVCSTDSENYAKVALDNGADDVILRDPEWEAIDYAHFSVAANHSINEYQRRTGHSYEFAAIVGGNIIFLRPSWLRAALTLVTDYHNFRMPINVVGEDSFMWTAGVCRIINGITPHSHYFHLRHSGILMEIDYAHEIELARMIVRSIKDGLIDYSADESVHDDIVANMELAENRMGGLSKSLRT